MKFSEIANLDETELRKKKILKRAELFQSRMKLKMQRLSNPLTLRLLKRDIARIETALSAKKKRKGVK